MARNKGRKAGFEESLASLEQIVGQLESGALPLERALELFEEGVGLARHCQEQLAAAERRVELLLRERGEIRTVPFETPDQTADDQEGGEDEDDEGDDVDQAIPF